MAQLYPARQALAGLSPLMNHDIRCYSSGYIHSSSAVERRRSNRIQSPTDSPPRSRAAGMVCLADLHYYKPASNEHRLHCAGCRPTAVPARHNGRELTTVLRIAR